MKLLFSRYQRRGLCFLAGLVAVVIPQGLFGAGPEFSAEDRAWWAVQAIAGVVPPLEEGHPVDGFMVRKLDGQSLGMAPVASAPEFIRRAFFDLHGLPPSPEEVEAFTKDWALDQDRAVEKLIDDLLESPRYGERWATHWLDVVRFSESDGYREDRFRPSAFLYRDYVVKAFNEDKPYDEFVREQLAADELAPDDPERMAATGFLRHGVYEWNQRNAEMQREIMINEITNVTGEVFLGLGVGCAQCHDHKFDPILQKDYFALQAFLSSTTWPDDQYYATKDEIAEYEAELKIWEDATAEIRAEVASLVEEKQAGIHEFRVNTFPAEVQEMFRKPQTERSSYEEQISLLVSRQAERDVRDQGTPEKLLKKDSPGRLRYETLKAELASFEGLKPEPLTKAFVSTDTGLAPAEVTIPGKEDEVIEPRFLSLLGGEVPAVTAGANTTGRRTALAEWIVREDNPLTARVMVNRIWQHHFGQGLAASPNDFGMLGESPSHPELLDWLAGKFVKGGWLMKPMHRLMMTSQVYRQTARCEPSERENLKDPSNRLLWRFPPRRLSAEQVRDAMLVISGELKHRDGGASLGNDSPVRSVYVKKLRNTPNPVLQCFDAPQGFASEPSRLNTTTATQSLLLANSPWPLARARAMAGKVLGGNAVARANEVAQAYRMAWGREPGADEIEGALKFLDAQAKLVRGEKPEAKPQPVSSLVSLSEGFKGAEGFLPGTARSALKLVPGSGRDRLALPKVSLSEDHFTISAIVNLAKIHPDGRVNTLISRWNGNQQTPGWSMGVTSAKSAYQPRNFIVQLIGPNSGGDVEYEVVASNLRVPLNRPVFLAVVIDPQPHGKGTVGFYLKDLSKADSPMESAVVAHNIAGSIRSDQLGVVVGGRDGGSSHRWEGQIARLNVTLSLPGMEELTEVPREGALIDLTFSKSQNGVPFPGTVWQGVETENTKENSPVEAFADFCHALLSSNEFLYLH
ncbi:DUF1549 and DUF1553 domain-containing protein [Verrucomicrobiaceae bacterium 227]